MSHYKPYPEYKDSGVEWIGEVPAHWEVKRLGHVGDIFKGSGGNKSDQTKEGVPCLRYGEIYTRYDSFLEKPVNYVSAESASVYTPLHPGDVVFTASGEDVSEIGKAVAVMFNGPLVCGGDTIILRPRWRSNHSTKFLGYLANAAPIAAQKSVSGTGFTVVHISGGKIKEVRLAWPQSGEQSQIATFLDRETTRIDTLIEKKQRFIELLEEKRQAAITQAVTKGLDPNVPMKDSGVAWIGEVPAHWRLKPIKRFAQFINGMAFKPHEWSDKGTPIIRIENLNGGLSFNHYDGDVDPRYYVHRGDLLFGWSGNKGTSFGPFIWSREGDFYLNQHIFRVDNIKAYTQWLYWVLRAVTKTIEEETHGIIGMVHVTKGKLGAIEIPELPNEEQVQIATFLDRETTRIDTLIEKTRDSIELLKERRSALITAAVTGKIDVREEAAA